MAKVSIIKATYTHPGIETLLAPLGGMEWFVKKNDKVLLKVNLLSAKEPQKAVTTHPEFVRAVAMDIAVCKILGIEPVGIPALKMAKIRGLWPKRIDYPIQGPDDVAYKGFRLPNTADHLLTGKKPPRKSPVITDKCTACGDCESICPKDAVKVQGRMAEITYSKCIRCFCCHEVCPEDAIILRSLKLN